MHGILVVAILGLGAVFLGLTLLIVLNKAWREEVGRRRHESRLALEPHVLAWAHGAEPALIPALGRTVGRTERAVLEEILLDHAQRVRGAEHERLSRALEELGSIDALVRRLGSRRWWQRADAAEKLGLSGARRACEHLIPCMQDPVPEVRMRAAKALGALGGTSPVRELVHALNEPSRWSTIRLADILTAMGRGVVDELLSYFDSLKLPGKLAAPDILARIRPLHAVPWIEARLDDAEADVRARACHALGALGDPRTARHLVRALEDPAWPVRAMAAKALGRLGHGEAVEPLARALRDAEWWVRSNAARALRGLGPSGTAALERTLESEDRFAREQAVLMLEETGLIDQRVRGLLASEPVERDRAVWFVKRLVDIGQTGRLEVLAAESPSAGLREELAGLLPAERAGAAGRQEEQA
jgi:HEAT repeat protein